MRNDYKPWKRKGFDKGGSTTPHVEAKAKSKRWEKIKEKVVSKKTISQNCSLWRGG